MLEYKDHMWLSLDLRYVSCMNSDVLAFMAIYFCLILPFAVFITSIYCYMIEIYCKSWKMEYSHFVYQLYWFAKIVLFAYSGPDTPLPFQDVQQERTTFVTSLLPLLAEYSLQPQVSDAQSIVSNIKVRKSCLDFHFLLMVAYIS